MSTVRIHLKISEHTSKSGFYPYSDRIFFGIRDFQEISEKSRRDQDD